jgi:DNA (cytosine-5)-methyltransferase 1
MDNQQRPNEGLRELALFAGAGGGILGGKLLGWRTVCAVEWEPYPACVLAARQNDGILPPFPIWDDVRTFDGKPWRGRVDVVSGGFPCQDISCAGKGAGIDGARSGLWAEMARICGEVEPLYIIVENSPMLTLRGLGVVLGNLAGLGYDARWGVLGHDDCGGQHQRKRIWIVANRNEGSLRQLGISGSQNQQWREAEIRRKNWINFLVDDDGNAPPSWRCEGIGDVSRPIMRRDADGVGGLMDRINAVGNGQVPEVVRLAWEILS